MAGEDLPNVLIQPAQTSAAGCGRIDGCRVGARYASCPEFGSLALLEMLLEPTAWRRGLASIESGNTSDYVAAKSTKSCAARGRAWFQVLDPRRPIVELSPPDSTSRRGLVSRRRAG